MFVSKWKPSSRKTMPFSKYTSLANCSPLRLEGLAGLRVSWKSEVRRASRRPSHHRQLDRRSGPWSRANDSSDYAACPRGTAESSFTSMRIVLGQQFEAVEPALRAATTGKIGHGAWQFCSAMARYPYAGLRAGQGSAPRRAAGRGWSVQRGGLQARRGNTFMGEPQRLQ